jgi:hypothetical protein
LITSHVAKGRIYQALYNDHTQDRLELHTRCRWDLPFQLIERCRPLGELAVLAGRAPSLTPSPRMRLAFSAPRRPLQDLWLRLKGCVQHELSSTSGCTEHRPSQHKSLDHFDLRRELHKVPEPSSCCKTRPLVSSLDSQEAAAAAKRPAHVSHAAPLSGHTCF